MMERMAFRWCLWLGGVHALREASKKTGGAIQRQQQAMRFFRRAGTLAGEGPMRVTFRRHAQHKLGAEIDVGAAPRRRWRRASKASRRRAQSQRVADGIAADRWGRWRIECVVQAEERRSGRGAARRWVKVRWAGGSAADQRWADWWLPWDSLSAAVKEEARKMGGWTGGAKQVPK